MPTTHTGTEILASASLAAATTVSTAEVNNSTGYGAIFTITLTNGASAPTTAPTVKFYIGRATGTKKLFYTASGDIVANSVNHINCDFPAKAMFLNADIVNGATNAITVQGDSQSLTTI